MYLRTIDRYRLLKKIASGGQSSIWLCHDPKSGMNVVLKVMECDKIGDNEAGLSLNREVTALMKLRHPNIVHLYDFKNYRNSLGGYLVMEYVDGMTLAERLRRDGRFHVDEVVRIALEVCSALSAAHSAGIVHKDIKPSNILLTRSGKVKLTDFGISSSGDPATEGGKRMGTARYMAPELAISTESADARSDLYSLGVTIYEMLVGRVPFDGPDTVAVSKKHLREIPAPPRRLDSGLPQWLNGVVMRLLNKNPANRYASAEELAGDLRTRRLSSSAVDREARVPFVTSVTTSLVVISIVVAAVTVLAGYFLVVSNSTNPDRGRIPPKALIVPAHRANR